MSRRVKLAIAALVVAVLIGGFYFPKLRQRVLRMSRPAGTEEQARREVTQPPIATPSDVKGQAKLFWASATAPGTLESVVVELPLSADPLQRSKQLIRALVADVPSPEQRTLPADVTLVEFYLLPDGTAVADFSDALSTETPSGILSEQVALDSIARTLAANVEPVRRLKVLVHGQEAETLAGHLDLTGFFPLRAVAPDPAAPAAPAKPAAGGLTPPGAPGKLGH